MSERVVNTAKLIVIFAIRVGLSLASRRKSIRPAKLSARLFIPLRILPLEICSLFARLDHNECCISELKSHRHQLTGKWRINLSNITLSAAFGKQYHDMQQLAPE
jgi:hypothetical protein